MALSFASVFHQLHQDGTITMKSAEEENGNQNHVSDNADPNEGQDEQLESMEVDSDSENEHHHDESGMSESQNEDDTLADAKVHEDKDQGAASDSDHSDEDISPPKRRKRQLLPTIRENRENKPQGDKRPVRRKLFKPKRKPARTPEAKKDHDLEKYPLLPPCKPSCKRKCLQKINQERREEIHSQFWDMEYNRRRDWIFSHIQVEEPKRRVLAPTSDVTRNFSRYYKMPDSEGTDQLVCAVFFRHTLGYKFNKIITHTLQSASPGAICTHTDSRGKHAPKHKLTDTALEIIKTHINSFHPSISHYRRAHAPLRRYLPPELSLEIMYQDFNIKHPGVCKKERYRKKLKSMNISFVKLGEEECEDCSKHKIHKETHALQDNEKAAEDCEECKTWLQHMNNADVTRKSYGRDKDRQLSPDEACVSVDMQKIIMLPRMPGIKNCVFTRRLVQFHQTFAPLGGKAKCHEKPIGVLWDESMSGRNAEDIATAYVQYMRQPQTRDKKKFTFYMDNCTAQNKNWTIYTAMVDEVNRPGGPDEVVFKYLEKGHTFMSADSFHHLVEKGMRDEKNVYDGHDFEQIVSKRGVTVQLNATHFTDYENGLSQGRYTCRPLLTDVQEVKFTRGTTKMMWKTSMTDENYLQGEFMKKKLAAKILKEDRDHRIFALRIGPRGIPAKKKTEILTNLIKFMPPNRRHFWENLPISESSVDLIDNE